MHPWPLHINNVRSFILIAIAVPSLTCANLSFLSTVSRKRLFIIFGLASLCGSLYILFNILGNYGSTLAMGIGGFSATEPNMPSGTPPFYGREVTIGFYILSGLSILVSGLHLLKVSLRRSETKTPLQMKYLLISGGSIILGSSLILGAIYKIWFLYYISAMISALISGTGILIDLREMRDSLQKTMPFIQEELTQLIRFQPDRVEDVQELVHILRLDRRINTFAVLEYRVLQPLEERVSLFNQKLVELNVLLGERFGDIGFFIVPLGKFRTGIAFASPMDKGTKESIDICEEMLDIFNTEHGDDKAFMGLGRSSEDILSLHKSYQEAVTAQGYASQYQQSRLVHIDDIQDSSALSLPVLMDLGHLSIAVRTGNLGEATTRFNLYYSTVTLSASGDIEIIRMQSIHFLSLIITDALSAGVHGLKMAERSTCYYRDLVDIKDSKLLHSFLLDALREIIEMISGIQSSKNSELISRTIKYLEENFRESLSVQKISQEMGVSLSYLQHLFKKETELPLTEYINMLRIREARKSLATSRASITDIAFDVGFNDSNYFSKVFKKSEGVSPAAYRRSFEAK